MIVKYLGDECNETEKQEIIHLLESNTEFKEVFEEVNSIWVKAPKTKRTYSNSEFVSTQSSSVDTILNKIDERIEYLEKEELYKQLTTIKPLYQRREVLISGIAASLLLLIGFFYLFPSLEEEQNDLPLITNIENPKGKDVKLVTLPDGSRVFLAGGSKISYNQHEFINTKRLVNFEGEAYFEVEKNLDRPFSVLTDKTETQVLGTAFNLLAYKSLSSTVLTVTEGKVSFAGLNTDKTKKSQSLQLTVNDQVAFDKLKNQFSGIKKLKTENKSIWKQHQIIFEDHKLEDVVVTLENRFNKDIFIQDEELKSRKITGNFANRNLEEILEVISIALEFDYKYLGSNKVILSNINE